jgi:hypothetical protein
MSGTCLNGYQPLHDGIPFPQGLVRFKQFIVDFVKDLSFFGDLTRSASRVIRYRCRILRKRIVNGCIIFSF